MSRRRKPCPHLCAVPLCVRVQRSHAVAVGDRDPLVPLLATTTGQQDFGY